MGQSDRVTLQDPRFGPAVSEFEFTVPLDYNHDHQIDTFAEKTKSLSTTFCFNEEFWNARFTGTTHLLVPGKTYKGKIFPILSRVPSDDCLSFYKKQQAFYVGAQGLTLIRELRPEGFPVDRWILSFDEKQVLYKIDGCSWVSGMRGNSDGDCLFSLSNFDVDCDVNYCLLCVYDSELEPVADGQSLGV